MQERKKREGAEFRRLPGACHVLVAICHIGNTVLSDPYDKPCFLPSCVRATRLFLFRGDAVFVNIFPAYLRVYGQPIVTRMSYERPFRSTGIPSPV